MADIEFTPNVAQDRAAPDQGGGFGMVANMAGAAISLALLVGVGIWGYKLMVRDVSGVPVVRALEGPMRVQPENPGGRPADHQGLAVNAVAADGSAAAPADTLILAPRPVDLMAEDAPSSLLVRPSVRPPQPAASEDEPAFTTTSAEIDALVAEIARGIEPLEDLPATPASAPIVAPEPVVVETVAAEEPAPSEAPEPQLVAQDVSGVTVSLRPQRRPAGGPPDAIVTPASLAAPVEELDIDPADVPEGTRVVQLGAYENGDIARSEWDRLAVRFGDYMEGKRRIVQEATSGGRTFFRLRVHGFEDLSDARRFCSALVAEGADCIPVVTR